MILLFQDDFVGAGRVRLSGQRLRHVLDVRRAKPGDELSVGLLNGDMGTATVKDISDESLEMDVSLFSPPPPALPLTLILALPRPKMLRRVFFSAGSMGVKKIFLINSYRVEKSYWQSPFISDEHIGQQLVLGLEQAKDTIMPTVQLRPRFKPFVEDELPEMARDTTAMVAHPAAAGPCPRNVSGTVVLAIGPEGGFIPYEIEKFSACGFKPVTIGERILRVETAVPYIISRLF